MHILFFPHYVLNEITFNMDSTVKKTRLLKINAIVDRKEYSRYQKKKMNKV